MPKITFYENDNTGSSAVADLAVVFVPGDVDVASDVKKDANGCIYIPSTATDISQYLNEEYSGYTENGRMNAYHMVEFLVEQGYGIVYKYIAGVEGEATDEYLKVSIDDTSDSFEALRDSGTLYYSLKETATEASDYVLVESDDTYEDLVSAEAQSFYLKVSVAPFALRDQDWEFLKDKNAYDIKFITAGVFGAVPVSFGTAQGTERYTFDFNFVNSVGEIATDRKDCAVLVDLDYYTVDTVITEAQENANKLLQDFQTALEFNNMADALASYNDTDGIANYIFKTSDALTQTEVEAQSSRESALVPNCTMEYSIGGSYTITVPSSIVYLYRYAQMTKSYSQWLSVAGVNRGVVGSVFTPDLDISKYFVDNTIIKDDAGISCNAICNVRPYGYTIWGDRTLLLQDETKGVQATSYLSLRNLVSDLVKTCYESAIGNTYESNNDTTWFNFKANIATLLDQMVSSGVLQAYKIKQGTGERNEIVAILTLYPYLPVENFTIYTNLENAEVTVES